MLTHLTLMPVCLVKAASAAGGRESAASATVIVTPDVLSEAAELPAPLPPPQAASTKASAAAPPAVAVWPSRPRLLRRFLANATLLRCAAIAGGGYGAASWHMRSQLRDQMLIYVQAVQVTSRTGILPSRMRSRQACEGPSI